MPETPITRKNVNIMHAKKNTKYAQQSTKYAKQNTKYANQNAKYAKQNTKCANSIKRVRQTNKYWFTLFCRDAIFVANLRTFLAYLLQVKKIWWRTENDKYEVWSRLRLTRRKSAEKRKLCWMRHLDTPRDPTLSSRERTPSKGSTTIKRVKKVTTSPWGGEGGHPQYQIDCKMSYVQVGWLNVLKLWLLIHDCEGSQAVF